MKPIGNLFLVALLILSLASSAQTKNAFYIKFSDKNTEFVAEGSLSKKAIERRAKFKIPFDTSDYPVNITYISQVLQDTSLTFRYGLKWHNAIVVESHRYDIESVRKHPFVSAVAFVGTTAAVTSVKDEKFVTPVLKLKDSKMSTSNLTEENYGVSYLQNKQIGATYLHKLGFDGSGVDLAVFDAGFFNIDKIPAFTRHQGNGLLTFGYDVVDLDAEMNDKDNHGTAVSSCIGSFDVNNYVGSAPKANLFLFRTENAISEYPIEELNWCKAAELADSAGVDMITSSLGYNQYDDTALSYTWSDLSGRKSYVSLSARLAVEKGIFVLNSAGNEGDKKWRKIGTPADVAEVLTIGAVNLNGELGSFSSQGYNALGKIKPDVCALGVKANVASTYGSYYQGYGTSYATPIAAGGVACLMQAFPTIAPQEMADVIRNTATNCSNPDSLLGYGVARIDLAYDVLNQQQKGNYSPFLMRTEQNRLILYTGGKADISYTIRSETPFLFIFSRKTKVEKGSIASNGPIAIIQMDQKKLKCNKKYTLVAEIHNSVENNLLKYNDLSFCEN